jgi:hypothetical protein
MGGDPTFEFALHEGMKNFFEFFTERRVYKNTTRRQGGPIQPPLFRRTDGPNSFKVGA